MKPKTLRAQVAELTEEVRALRAEVAALRMAPPVQFVPYVPVPMYPVLPLTPWPGYPDVYFGDAPPRCGLPAVTIAGIAASGVG